MPNPPITPNKTQGWPHTPGKRLFERAEQAHLNVYHTCRTPSGPVPAPDFPLAELFDELTHVNTFRTPSPQRLPRHARHQPQHPAKGPRHRRRPHRLIPQHHRHSRRTPRSTTGPNPTSFSLLVRDPGWLGMDPILPLFKNTHAIIIGDPQSGRPHAAIGLPDPITPKRDHAPTHPEHPETAALQIILGWHGATVQWFPFNN